MFTMSYYWSYQMVHYLQVFQLMPMETTLDSLRLAWAHTPLPMGMDAYLLLAVAMLLFTKTITTRE